MELQSINISRTASYSPRPNEYEGTITIKGQHGTIQVILDNKLSSEVLKLCADSLTRATKELAQNLTAAVFENAGPAIEDKS